MGAKFSNNTPCFQSQTSFPGSFTPRLSAPGCTGAILEGGALLLPSEWWQHVWFRRSAARKHVALTCRQGRRDAMFS